MEYTPQRDERDLAAQTRTGGAIPADTLAIRLLLARHFAGQLSQREAAERCGLNYGSWANWEAGRRPRDVLDVVAQVSVGLGVDHDWLLWGGPLTPSRGASAKRPPTPTEEYLGPPARTMRGETNGVPRQRDPGSRHRRPVRLPLPVAA